LQSVDHEENRSDQHNDRRELSLGDLIQEARRRGLPRHIEGKIEAFQDMVRLVMVSDDYPDEWG
jgi:hypothetical protein